MGKEKIIYLERHREKSGLRFRRVDSVEKRFKENSVVLHVPDEQGKGDARAEMCKGEFTVEELRQLVAILELGAMPKPVVRAQPDHHHSNFTANIDAMISQANSKTSKAKRKKAGGLPQKSKAKASKSPSVESRRISKGKRK